MKYSTATVTPENKIVPWLAADGFLSYSPFSPPITDYFFLYNFILPKIFSDHVNLREHYWFGDYNGKHGHTCKIIQEFWNKARDKKIMPIFAQNVSAGLENLEAPMAIFKIYTPRQRLAYFLFIQHGSYLLIPAKLQPIIESGFVLLYRGIGSSNKFRIYQMLEEELLLKHYQETLKNSLIDSVKSFNITHGAIYRTETSHLLHASHLFSENFSSSKKFNHERHEWRKFSAVIQQCYTLRKEIAKDKFGPSFVTFKTPISNIRICTYFAGEYEVKILSLDKLIPVKAVKCKWERGEY